MLNQLFYLFLQKNFPEECDFLAWPVTNWINCDRSMIYLPKQ